MKTYDGPRDYESTVLALWGMYEKNPAKYLLASIAADCEAAIEHGTDYPEWYAGHRMRAIRLLVDRA